MNRGKQIRAPSRVLVVLTRRIGDVLLSTPMIRTLRLAWPQAKIDVLVFSGTEGVLSGNPDLNTIITVLERPTLLQHLNLLWRLLCSYDLAISMMPSDRPTLYAIIAGKRSVGLIGCKHFWKKWLLSQSVLFDNTNTHTVLMNLKLADLLGLNRNYEVVVGWCEEDEAFVRKILGFNPGEQTYAVLHVYPMYAYKAWRTEAWVELADWLYGQGVRVVLTGGKGADELAYVDRLMGLLPRDTINTAGQLSLAAVSYLLSKACAFVGPDTVVTHLAAASGTATVALFGPSNPVKWGPWPKNYGEDRNPYKLIGTQRVNNVVMLQGSGNCVPCVEEGCERHIASLSECLQNLPAASAIAALRELIHLPC